ncbi:MAG: hypothetical protein KatS3mg105_1248 [Gemmatales bacterium]|nr:MAG: hypothetical protein KatS3mg105_1248 [Gemmatales bacterium]
MINTENKRRSAGCHMAVSLPALPNEGLPPADRPTLAWVYPISHRTCPLVILFETLSAGIDLMEALCGTIDVFETLSASANTLESRSATARLFERMSATVEISEVLDATLEVNPCL